MAKEPIVFDAGIPERLTATEISSFIQNQELAKQVPVELRSKLTTYEAVQKLMNDMYMLMNKITVVTTNPIVAHKEWAAW